MAKKKKDECGLTIIITGDGKGKTTAAIGMTVRAVGRGMKVLFIQFLKNAEYGEHQILKELSKCKVKIFGRGFCKICGDTLPIDEHKEAAQKALRFVQEEFKKNRYSMIILDEINCAIHAKLMTMKQVLAILKNKPKEMHVVLTGRGAPAGLIKKADLVSECRDIRHPFRKGVKAQKGIEF